MPVDMRYLMKQKVFTLGDKFAIQNERGEAVYFVEGEIFTLGHKLSFQDAAGNELIYIRQKLLSLPPTYELYRGSQHVATINKELFTFFHCTFDIHVDAEGDLVAEGNLTDHEYTITRGGRPAAQISKQWFQWGDTYGVEIDDREDAVTILASTVVIDMCCHESKRR
ncbi:MAG TPA: LURP-one-related family protein [Candidatus Limnocylindrales bacterium]|nr:LURP-one-related family protein [Candidatus Limnocylindrales bacterium]